MEVLPLLPLEAAMPLQVMAKKPLLPVEAILPLKKSMVEAVVKLWTMTFRS
jgi:hypothetical protein